MAGEQSPTILFRIEEPYFGRARAVALDVYPGTEKLGMLCDYSFYAFTEDALVGV